MSIVISDWQFEGPITDTKDLHDKPGIYVISTRKDDSIIIVWVQCALSVLGSINKNPFWKHRDELNTCAYVRYSNEADIEELEQIKKKLVDEYSL